LDAEPSSRPAESRLHLVRHEQDAVLLAVLGQAGQEARPGDHEPAFAEDGLDHQASDVLGADLLVHLVDGPRGA
jgi:hypothetical protein